MVKSHPQELVLIAARVHLFPFRTQKLSSLAPTILGGRLPGKIGNANTKSTRRNLGAFFFYPQKVPGTVHRTVLTAPTILDLPGKPDNANTKSTRNNPDALSFYLITCM